MRKLIIIGGGPAGYTAAIEAARAHAEVFLIEQDKVGGTCLQRGCIPTKALLEDAHILKAAAALLDTTQLNYSAVRLFEKKDRLVAQLTQGIEDLLNAHKITLIHDQAVFVNHSTIHLNQLNLDIEADEIIIATGSETRCIPLDCDEPAKCWSSDDVLSNPLEPGKNLLIIGGGVIGVELASMLAQLGHTVTISEKETRILPTVERELAQSLSMDLKKMGIRILTRNEVGTIRFHNNSADVQVIKTKTDIETFDQVIIAVGRKAVTEKLGLDKIGVATNHGFIQVDSHFMTSVPLIYAIGDVNGSAQLAHVAASQAKQLIAFLFEAIQPKPILIPYGIYTPIQIAYAGLNEEEVKAKQIPYQVSKFLMSAMAKQKIKADARSFIKIITDESHYILGVSLYCSDATELLSFFVLMMENQLKVEDAQDLVFPHPTLSEAIGEVLVNLNGKAIHTLPKAR